MAVSTSWNPQGLSRPVSGIALPLTYGIEGRVLSVAGMDNLENSWYGQFGKEKTLLYLSGYFTDCAIQQ
jgi:hypothetical protein